jgi:hypothetical protein
LEKPSYKKGIPLRDALFVCLSVEEGLKKCKRVEKIEKVERAKAQDTITT